MNERSQSGQKTGTGGGSRGPGSTPSSSSSSPTSSNPSSPSAYSASSASSPRHSGDGVSLQPSLETSASGNDLVSVAASVAASLSADLKETAKTVSRAVTEQASEFAADVGHELSKTAENQKTRGVDAMQGFARAISSAAAELEGQSPRVAKSVRDAAGKIEGLSDNLSHRSVDDLMKAATELARSQPTMFIAGAVVAGFALSRFLKSSANGSHQSSGNNGSQQGSGAKGSHPGGSTQGSHMSSGNRGAGSDKSSSDGQFGAKTRMNPTPAM
jgi:hypothetical protein